MALLTVTKITRSGVLESLVAASSTGDQFPNDGKVFLVVRNGGAAAITVTVDATSSVKGVPFQDVQFSVAAGETRFAGPWPPEIFNDSNGRVNITYSSVTSVTVGAFSLDPLS